jgi:type VI secretion system protein ImpK
MEAQEPKTLMELSSRVFAGVLALRSPGFNPDYQVFRRSVQEALRDMEDRGRRQGIPPGDVELAKYALVGFVDEMVTTSEWPGRDPWLSNRLQDELYEGAMAGEEFFNKLEQLNDSQRQVMEVYYYCMALGFCGRYDPADSTDRTELERLQADLRRRLAGGGIDPRGPLTPKAYTRANRLEREGGAIPWGWISVAGGFVVLTIGLILIFRVILGWQAEGVVESILGLK